MSGRFPIAHYFGFSINSTSNPQERSLVFGLPMGSITTHSARTGAALQDFPTGSSAETISITGRWASLTSLRYYPISGRAWLLQMPLSVEQETLIRQIAMTFGHVVDEILAS